MTGLGEDLPFTAGAIIRRNLLPWVALVALLALTCTLAYVPMGRGNLVVSLGIAAAKTTIIALFFMGLRRPDPLLRLAACAALLWIGFMFALTFGDQQTRPPQGEPGTVTPDSTAPLATGRRLF